MVSVTCDHFIDLHYNTAESAAIFVIVSLSLSVKVCLPPLYKRVCFRPVKVFLLPLQLLAHRALQCLVSPVIVSLKAVSKQIRATLNPCGHGGEDVHLNFVMASAVRTPEYSLTQSWRSDISDTFLVRCAWWRWAFKFFLLILATRYSCCSSWGGEVCQNNVVSCQKIAGIIFAVDGAPSLSSSLRTSYGVNPSIAAYIWVQSGGVKFHNLWPQAKESSCTVQKSVTTTLLESVLQPPSFVSLNELRSWNNQTLQQFSLRSFCPGLGFSIIYLSSIDIRRLSVHSFSFATRYRSVRVTILQCVTKFCSYKSENTFYAMLPVFPALWKSNDFLSVPNSRSSPVCPPVKGSI